MLRNLKKQIAIRLFNKFSSLKKNKVWRNHFWLRWYYIDTVRINEEMIREYVKYQEKHEYEDSQLSLNKM
ncbi:transposase [Xenorhabdus khoisanae]